MFSLEGMAQRRRHENIVEENLRAPVYELGEFNDWTPRVMEKRSSFSRNDCGETCTFTSTELPLCRYLHDSNQIKEEEEKEKEENQRSRASTDLAQ